MSQFKVCVLPFRGDCAEEDELNGFLRSHRILRVEKTVLPDGWGFCIEWEPARGAEPSRGLRYPEKVDYMKELPPPVFARFSRLRTRRRELAKESGMPAYGICTDAQLAEIARMENPSVPGLKAIEGLGPARIAEYGSKLLEALTAKDEVTVSPEGEVPEQ